jgi:hypothetical protein
MYSQKNPYAASLAADTQAKAPPKKPDKPRDEVLSRVQKRAQVAKPPVKFSMAPRYRFALPDPPTDLKMLRGTLQPTADAAMRTTKLELDAKKVAVPLHPSFGLRADLVVPAQYAHRAPGMEISPEDQIVLAAIQPRVGAGGTPKDTSGSGRRALPPPKRAKATAAFPWMRRMSYDEYASGTGATDRRSTGGGTATSVTADAMRAKKLEDQRRRERVGTFFKANAAPASIRHPDRAKRHLTVASVVPVFRDLDDCHADLISMQFDMMAPLESTPRFAGKRERGEEAFKSAISISLSDDKNKKFVSCFVPDERSLNEIGRADAAVPRAGDEYHELLREYSIRVAGVATQRQELPAGSPRTRTKGTFVMTSVGEGESAVVGLSDIPNAWLLAPRAATLTPLARPALELRRDPLTSDVKRRRLEKAVDQLCEKL